MILFETLCYYQFLNCRFRNRSYLQTYTARGFVNHAEELELIRGYGEEIRSRYVHIVSIFVFFLYLVRAIDKDLLITKLRILWW